MCLHFLLKQRAGSLVKPLTVRSGEVNLNHPSQVFIQLHQNFQWRFCMGGLFFFWQPVLAVHYLKSKKVLLTISQVVFCTVSYVGFLLSFVGHGEPTIHQSLHKPTYVIEKIMIESFHKMKKENIDMGRIFSLMILW